MVYVFGVKFVYIGYTIRSLQVSVVSDACLHLTTAYAQRRKFVLDAWSNGHILGCIAQSPTPPHEVVGGSDGANIDQSAYSELMDASISDPPSHTHFAFSDNMNCEPINATVDGDPTDRPAGDKWLLERDNEQHPFAVQRRHTERVQQQRGQLWPPLGAAD